MTKEDELIGEAMTFPAFNEYRVTGPNDVGDYFARTGKLDQRFLKTRYCVIGGVTYSIKKYIQSPPSSGNWKAVLHRSRTYNLGR